MNSNETENKSSISNESEKIEADSLLYQMFNSNSQDSISLNINLFGESVALKMIASNINNYLLNHGIDNKDSFSFLRKLPDDKEWHISNFNQQLSKFQGWVAIVSNPKNQNVHQTFIKDLLEANNIYFTIINYGKEIELIEQKKTARKLY